MTAVRLSLFLITVTAAAACTEMAGVRDGEPEVIESTVEQLDEQNFAVSVTALNMDGYELARCVAASHVDSLRDEDGERLHDVYRRTGGRITDEFRVSDAVRTRTTSGLQTYSVEETDDVDDHDGRDVMAVDLQLAECEKADMATVAK